MTKILIAYYSRTNTTKKLAEYLQEQLGGDLDAINSVKDRSGVPGYFLCGQEAMQKTFAEIKPVAKNPADYDLVIIGTPVWGWNISSPVRTYLIKNLGKIKNIAVFCTMGGSGDKGVVAEVARISGLKPIAGLGLLTREILDGNFEPKTKAFIDNIKK